jgi:glycine oxidase
VKARDVIVVGGGLIGISIALAARRRGLTVLVLDRADPGGEASSAAAGMLAHCDPHLPALLAELAAFSAKMYPEFVRELEEESGQRVDFRREGTILLVDSPSAAGCPPARVY